MTFPKVVETFKLTPSQVGKGLYERRSSETFLIKVRGTGERHDYVGPAPQIYIEDGWLRIVSDPYDNTLMLNAEAIPHLIKVLRKLQKPKAEGP